MYRASIGLDTTRHINGKCLSVASIDAADDTLHLFLQCACKSRAEDAVDDKIRKAQGHAEAVKVVIIIQGVDKRVHLLQDAKHNFRRCLDMVAIPCKKHLDIRPCVQKVARGTECIAAIIPAACNDNDMSSCKFSAKKLLCRLCRRMPCVFHQDKLGNTVDFLCFPIHFAHLICCQ